MTSYAPVIASGIRFSWNASRSFYESAPAGPTDPVPYIVLCEANTDGNVRWFANSYNCEGIGDTQELAVADFIKNLIECYRGAIKVLEDLTR